MARHWLKVGIVKGFIILRLKNFPAFLYDTTNKCEEKYRTDVWKLVDEMEKEGLTMEDAKKYVMTYNRKL